MPIYESPLLTLGQILFTSTERAANMGTRKKTENFFVRGFFWHWQNDLFACPGVEFMQTRQSSRCTTGPAYDKTLNYDEIKFNIGDGF